MPRDYEYWKSPAVKWMLSKSKTRNPEMFMRQNAKELLSKTEQHNPPFSPFRIAPLRNIIRIEWAEMRNVSELTPTKGGFLIKVNSKPSAPSWGGERYQGRPSGRFQNFSIAHEIGHTFFYDTSLAIPSRPYNDVGSLPEERLCDIFAAELLMPEEKFKDDAKRVLNKYEYPITGIIELSNLYKVSLRALVIRLFELKALDRSRHAIIMWNWSLNPNKPRESKRKLRVEWSEPSTFPYIPKHDSTPVDSVFGQAALNKNVVSENARIRIGSLRGNYLIEAVAIPSKARGKHESEAASQLKPVLSIIWLDNSPQLETKPQ